MRDFLLFHKVYLIIMAVRAITLVHNLMYLGHTNWVTTVSDGEA